MNKQQIKSAFEAVNHVYNKAGFDNAYKAWKTLMSNLFKNQQYRDLIELYEKADFIPPDFETAYSYQQIGNISAAADIYEILLSSPSLKNNTAILNNLSNIKKNNGEIETAFKLIKRARRIDPNDKIININYEVLSQIATDNKNKKDSFRSSLENLSRETEWAISKLLKFIDNVKKESSYVNGTIAIPQWKFKVLMSTDDSKATSLKDQWIQKGYILATSNRDSNRTNIYEINPYLEAALNKIKPIKINQQWFDGFENINQETLTAIDYFNLLTLIQKVNKKYQSLMQRDFNELVFNYLTKNKKSTIILAGSFIELLFTYHCEKKKVKNIEYTTAKNKKTKIKLYNCKMHDFLDYFKEQTTHSMSKTIQPIGNIARIYRNFIHPGNELSSKEMLDDSKMEICFHSVVQLMKSLIK